MFGAVPFADDDAPRKPAWRRRAAVLLALLVALAGAPPPASATEIGVVLAGTRLAFWRTMVEGIKRAAEELQVDLVIRSPVDGAAISAQPNIQLRMIDYLQRRQVAGIVLAPEPLQGVAAPVPLEVPLVLVDRRSADYAALSIVATDNLAAGRAAAGSLAPVLSEGAKVAILRLAPTITSTTDREEGILSVARERGWEVAVDSYVGFESRESLVRTVAALQGYPGRLDAVFAPNETTAYGALRVVAALPPEERPHLVVFDWREELAAALESGLLHAAIVQDPYRMGYQAVAILVAAIAGRPPPPEVAVEVVVVTRDSLQEAAVQALLSRYRE